MRRGNRTVGVAFCGIVTALGVLCLAGAGLLPIFYYILPAVAGLLLIPIVIELGHRFAWSTYAAVSLLGLLLAPNREIVLLYVLFFGHYMIVKALIEGHVRRRIWQAILKLLVFTASMALDFFVCVFVLGVPASSFSLFGVFVPGRAARAGECRPCFFTTTRAPVVVALYMQRLHPVLQRLLSRGR